MYIFIPQEKEIQMETSLADARINVATATTCLHVLAAANHRQWAKWEGSIVPLLERGDTSGLDALVAGELSSGLSDQLVTDAQVAIRLIEQIAGSFAWTAPVGMLVERKRQQLASWVTYARSCEPDAYERWKLQCRTPFIELSPKQQRSDYDEAVLDLQTVASAGGLVLPNPLPKVFPLIGRAAYWRHLSHQFGAHGPYMVSEQPWSAVCQACHASRSYTP